MRAKRRPGRQIGFEIPVFVIVGQVQVPILEQAVGHDEVMRFIAAETYAPIAQEEGPAIDRHEGQDGQHGDSPARRPGDEPVDDGAPFRFSLPVGLDDADNLKIKDGQADRPGEKTEPFQEVVPGEVMAEGQRRKKEKGDRKICRKIEGQGLLVAEPAVFRPDLTDQSPEAEKEDENQGRGEEKRIDVRAKVVISDRE